MLTKNLCAARSHKDDWEVTNSWGLHQILCGGFIHYWNSRNLLTGQRNTIQTAQNMKLHRRNSKEGEIGKEQRRNLERGGWRNNKIQFNYDKAPRSAFSNRPQCLFNNPVHFIKIVLYKDFKKEEALQD